MPDQDWSASTARLPADPDRPAAGWATFTAISDAHAAHLFDYCCALGREDDALAAAQAAVSDAASRNFPSDVGRLRAWLFGRARLELVGAAARGRGGPGYAPASVLGRYRAAGPRAGDAGWPDAWRDEESAWSAVTAFRALPDRLREVLDLAYRHGIRSEDLPTALGLPADEAAWLLVSAEETFSQLAALSVPPGQGQPPAIDGYALEHLADFPLVPLPAEYWERRWPDVPGAAANLADDGTSVLPGVLAAHLPAMSARFPAGRRLQVAGLAATVVIAVGATLGYVAFQGNSNGGGQATLAGGTTSANSGALAPVTPAAPAAATTSPSHAAHRNPAAAPSLRSLLAASNQSGSTPPTVTPTVTAKPAPRKTSSAPKTSASAHPSSSASAHPSSSASPSPSSSASASPSSSATPDPSSSADPSPSSSASPDPSSSATADPSASGG